MWDMLIHTGHISARPLEDHHSGQGRVPGPRVSFTHATPRKTEETEHHWTSLPPYFHFHLFRMLHLEPTMLLFSYYLSSALYLSPVIHFIAFGSCLFLIYLLFYLCFHPTILLNLHQTSFALFSSFSCFLSPLLSYISHPILSSFCPLILFSSLSCFIPSSLALVSLSTRSASSRACLCYLCSAGRSGAMIRLHNSHTARDGAGKCKEVCACVCACASLCVCVFVCI